jgi:hypothetical protein
MSMSVGLIIKGVAEYVGHGVARVYGSRDRKGIWVMGLKRRPRLRDHNAERERSRFPDGGGLLPGVPSIRQREEERENVPAHVAQLGTFFSPREPGEQAES